MDVRSRGGSVSAGVLATLLTANICLEPAAFGSSGQEDSKKEQAAALAKKANRAGKSGEPANAYLFYSEASALQPSNRKLKQKMQSLQTRAALQSPPVPPETPDD